VTEFDSTVNGILVCTQQSLSSSVNIPESSILLCIPRAVVIQLADAAELLDDDTVNLTFVH